MARITVEDCLRLIPNRHELVLLAAHRARELNQGHEHTVPSDRDKIAVIALREIAEGTVSTKRLRSALIERLSRVEIDEPIVEEGNGSAFGDMTVGTPPTTNTDDHTMKSQANETDGVAASGRLKREKIDVRIF